MTPSKQGFYSRLKVSPNALRRLMNLWPPFWAMGIHIVDIAPDWRSARVRMKLKWRNKNYVGTHFGGSLFSMTDPFYMLLFMNLLGKEFTVWDKSAKIDFLAPGRGTMHAHFEVTEAMLADVRAHTTGGQKYEPTYEVAIIDDDGERIASVLKTLYIRRRPAA